MEVISVRTRTRKAKWVYTLFALLLFIVTACSNNEPASSPETSSPASPQASESASSASSDSGATTYPMQTDVTLGYWSEINTFFTGTVSDYQDVPFFQEWQKRTGVKLDFTLAPLGQGKEAFNVMLASGELPDMIETDWLNVPGGPQKMIDDGYILRLNDLINAHAPNLKKYLQEHPDVDKMLKTDNGSYYVFPFLRGDDSLKVYQGPVVRQDWLDELGLPAPITIDDWYNMLKAFKEKKGAAAPLSFLGVPGSSNRPLEGIVYGAFVGAWDVNRSFYVEDGKVQFGPAQPGYKEFLGTFSKWYAEGLIDKNIAIVDGKALDANITTGATGATIGNSGGGIGKWTPLLLEKDPKAKLAGVPYPVLTAGAKPKFGQKDNAYPGYTSVAISAKSKNPELAVKMLDYAFGAEGHTFFNFGTEGVSYNLEGDYPKYTDLIMKNPDKLAPSQAMPLYFRASYGGPFVQDVRYIEQYFSLQEQKDAVKTWNTDADKYALPPVSATSEEASELANIMSDIYTQVDEMTLKVILGAESVDEFDNYLQRLESLNLKRAIEIQQGALERYNNR